MAISSLLGTGNMTFNNVHIKDMTVSEALHRVNIIRLKLSTLPYQDNVIDAIKELARFSLEGDQEAFNMTVGEKITIDHVNLDELDEAEMAKRIYGIKIKFNILSSENSFAELARYALTGVPF